MSGTGLLGFTRDDGANGAFTGTLDGDGHTLTVSVGEVWGLTSAGASLPGGSIDGYIRRHGYFGLFAKTSGATFTDLTLDGISQLKKHENGMEFVYSGDIASLLGVLHGQPIADLCIEEPSLEEVFMHYYDNSEQTEDNQTGGNA